MVSLGIKSARSLLKYYVIYNTEKILDLVIKSPPGRVTASHPVSRPRTVYRPEAFDEGKARFPQGKTLQYSHKYKNASSKNASKRPAAIY